MTAKTPILSYDVYFAAPAEKVWAAVTEGALTEKYFYGTRLESTLEKGARLSYTAGTATMVDGEVIEIQRGHRLVARQRSLWDEKVAKDRASTVTWEVTPLGANASKLRLVHDDFGGENETYRQSMEGWPVILSGMKTLVETGAPLVLSRA